MVEVSQHEHLDWDEFLWFVRKCVERGDIGKVEFTPMGKGEAYWFEHGSFGEMLEANTADKCGMLVKRALP